MAAIDRFGDNLLGPDIGPHRLADPPSQISTEDRVGFAAICADHPNVRRRRPPVTAVRSIAPKRPYP
jgi:hypothetical protein